MKSKILDQVLNYYQTKQSSDKFQPGISSIPVSGAIVTPQNIQDVVESVLSGWFTEGIHSTRFQISLRRFFGMRHALLCNSGSSANLLAVSACKTYFQDLAGDMEKDKYAVLTSATAFPTTVFPIVQNGYHIIFVDTDPETLNPSTSTILDAMEKYKDILAGIILAHTLGFPYDASAIREKCDEYGMWFIEDCADCVGNIHGKKVGTFGDAATLSFFPAHFVTTGEGGAVITNSGKLFKELGEYSSWGRDCYCKPGQSNTCNKRFEHEWKNLPDGWDHKYTFTKFGYNLKMTDMQAALGHSQMKLLPYFIDARRSNFRYLLDELSVFGEHLGFVKIPEWAYASPFGFPITVRTDAFTKQDLVSFLESRNIQTRTVFAGNITRQPVFDNYTGYTIHDTLEGSDYVMDRTFWIGNWPGLGQDHLDYMVGSISEFMRNL